jgi:hypothetical protein
MIHTIPAVVLLLQATQLVARPAVAHPVPLDTTIAAPASGSVALALEAGGAVRVLGGDSKVVRVRITDRGRHCADCIVTVSNTIDGVRVQTARTRQHDAPADLQVQIEVPMQTTITLTSAGGEVAIEGIDGTVSGTTEFGTLDLLRLSGPLLLETKRGDVTLRQSYVHGRVHTNAGRVLLEDVGGNVRGTTGRGSVIERRVERVPTAP